MEDYELMNQINLGDYCECVSFEDGYCGRFIDLDTYSPLLCKLLPNDIIKVSYLKEEDFKYGYYVPPFFVDAENFKCSFYDDFFV